jgi:hypothetical protein
MMLVAVWSMWKRRESFVVAVLFATLFAISASLAAIIDDYVVAVLNIFASTAAIAAAHVVARREKKDTTPFRW